MISIRGLGENIISPIRPFVEPFNIFSSRYLSAVLFQFELFKDSDSVIFDFNQSFFPEIGESPVE
jgi:hypothetical protein